MNIDVKTQRGNGNKNQKANHIVSAMDENGFCLGQKRVGEKSNEITAIYAFGILFLAKELAFWNDFMVSLQLRFCIPTSNQGLHIDKAFLTHHIFKES